MAGRCRVIALDASNNVLERVLLGDERAPEKFCAESVTAHVTIRSTVPRYLLMRSRSRQHQNEHACFLLDYLCPRSSNSMAHNIQDYTLHHNVRASTFSRFFEDGRRAQT
jgi:hypothetical protein